MVKINLKQMKMKDFVVWQENVHDATQSNDLIRLGELQSQIVSEWDFPGDPHDPNAYGELTLEQWMQVQKEAAQVISEGFSI